MSNGFTIENLEDGIVIRFGRPEIRNPLSTEVIVSLIEFLSSLSPSLRRIVFTGANDVFASGADLREIASIDGSNARDFAELGQALMRLVASSTARTFAAVNGFCYGGALDLALSCDRRIASPTATFCHPGAGLGIMTGWGGTQRLPRIVGEAKALEMFLTGKVLSAEEAMYAELVESIADDPVQASVKACL